MRNSKGQFMKGHKHSPKIEKKRLFSISKIIKTPQEIERVRQLGLKNKGVKNTWSKPPHFTGEKSSHWKGDEILYYGLHTANRKSFGKASKCENKKCKYPKINQNGIIYNSPKRYEWALRKGHEYSRNIKDYLQLCPSCHRLYDLEKLTI